MIEKSKQLLRSYVPTMKHNQKKDDIVVSVEGVDEVQVQIQADATVDTCVMKSPSNVLVADSVEGVVGQRPSL
jgi:hypothetical protein